MDCEHEEGEVNPEFEESELQESLLAQFGSGKAMLVKNISYLILQSYLQVYSQRYSAGDVVEGL